MFYQCTVLTAIPTLPATNLAPYCYNQMFYECTALKTPPTLPATTLSANCYSGMFHGCTSLTAAPALQATTLADNCYQNMFYGCSSLKDAPVLSATELAKGCYYGMFANCSNLSSAITLPATTLVNDCYTSMFLNCAKLSSIEVAFRDWNEGNNTASWVDGVASSGFFQKRRALSTVFGISNIPTGWRVENNEPLSFQSYGNTTVALNKINYPYTTTIQCSFNDGDWQNYTLGSGIALTNHDTVAFKGDGRFSRNIQNRYCFSTTGEGTLAVYGKLRSLISSTTLEDRY